MMTITGKHELIVKLYIPGTYAGASLGKNSTQTCSKEYELIGRANEYKLMINRSTRNVFAKNFSDFFLF